MHTETHGHAQVELKFVYGEKISVKFPLGIHALGWETVFGQVVPSVSKECSAFIFMDQVFQKEQLCAILMDAQPLKMKATLIFLDLLHVDTQRVML